MSNVGIDLGTTFTKTSINLIFPSGISNQICMSNNILQVNDKQYAMELFNDKATYDTNINKSLNQNIKLNYIYALGKSTTGFEGYYENVIVGLPPSQWNNENTVEKFKELLQVEDNLQIQINGKPVKLYVECLSIVPEDVPAYYAINYQQFAKQKVLLLGLGSLTLNQILFQNDEVIDMHTDELGVLKVFKDLAQEITSKTGYNVKMEDIHSILQYGFFIKGKQQDINNIITPIINKHCEIIYRNLKLKWSIDTIPFVLLLGGGGIALHNYICKYIPHIILLENAQTISVMGMGRMAGELY
ncbi:MAG TPA: hypothetical protein GX708_22795 [Gallicola sp.]|nr:hypothetical protein [Gallicola sp.]